MCECLHPDCMGLIAIKLSEYEAARSAPRQYLVKAGHEVSDDERIVAHADGHVIVKKLREKVGPTVSQPSTNGHDSEAARVAS